MKKKLSYSDSGVRYDVLDSFKRACQSAATGTEDGLRVHNLAEAEGIRGESAYLVETPTEYLAHVEEALGTKSLIADAMYQATGRSFYRNVAIDDVSTIVNDLCTTGALPVSVAMFVAVGDAAYLSDETRCRDLAEGFAAGCAQAGAAWAGGETQVLRGIVDPGAMVLGGSAFGRIVPKYARVAGNVQDGDVIVCLASSGIQTNGATLCRAIADRLPAGYSTKLADGRTFGEALLDASLIYTPFVKECQEAGVHVHYAVHLTGHGWRKLMRLEEPFVYKVARPPDPQPVFRFIQEAAEMDDREAHGTFNMGAGFVVYVRPKDVSACLDCAASTGVQAWPAGHVRRDGHRKAVEIPALDVVFEADSLQIR